MRRVYFAIVLMLCSLAMSRANAQPVQVSQSEYTVLSASMDTLTEDFDRFPIGPVASPVQLRNGVYTGNPRFGAPWCLLSRCLNVGFEPGTFAGFPTNTVLWSARLIPSGGGSQAYIADVVGRSGARRIAFTITGPGTNGAFVGFHDPLGLLQVTFTLATAPFGSNYSLDDVVVAIADQSPANVPTVSVGGALLLILLLALLGGVTIRRLGV